MIKSRIAQLIYISAFCTLGIIGAIASVGLFEAQYAKGFYVYFTNLSNYFCLGIMIAELIFVIKKLKNNENGSVSVSPLFKFIGVIMIVVTFAVYNFLLAKDRTIYQNLSIRSILLHIILPVMYVLDWILFYDRKQIKWFYPLLTLIAPAIYAVYVFIRAWILGGVGVVIYPYFFLDPTKIGVIGVLKWLGILFVVFLALGYIFYAIDKIKRRK